MPVPSSLSSLSTTASSNSPAGSEQVFPQLDDYIRFQSACLAQLRDQKLSLTGGTLSGPVVAGDQSSNTGSVRSMPGNSTITGAISFHNNTGSRHGYIGYGPVGGSEIPIFADTGKYYRFQTAAPRSAVAASNAEDLTRKQEVDAAVAAVAATVGNSLLKANNLSDIANAATALTNLGGLAQSDFEFVNANPGRLRIKNFLLQWGFVSVPTDGSAVAAFSTPFGAAWSAQATVIHNSTEGSSSTIGAHILNWNTTHITLGITDENVTGAHDVHYVAFGSTP